MNDVPQLLDHVQRVLPQEWAEWPGGWPGEIEVALLDAVFSIRAHYSGVLHVVERWRAHRGVPVLDDLDQLARHGSSPDALQAVVGNSQRVPDGQLTKAEAVSLAAERLLEAGVVSSGDLDIRNDTQRRAYTSVTGLGEVTWAYLGMLLGEPGVKADTMIRRFVAHALDLPDVPAERARSLVQDVAGELGVSPTQLDHAIWSYQRDRPSQADAGPAPT